MPPLRHILRSLKRYLWAIFAILALAIVVILAHRFLPPGWISAALTPNSNWLLAAAPSIAVIVWLVRAMFEFRSRKSREMSINIELKDIEYIHDDPRDFSVDEVKAKTRGDKLRSKGQPQGRYVNVWFTARRDDESGVGKKRALIKDEPMFLRLAIGPFDRRTILTEATPFPDQEEINHRFPETEGKPLPLEITLFSNDFEIVGRQSQAVDLLPGRPTEPRYFRVIPRSTGEARLRVCIFYRNHLLQSLAVYATVKEQNSDDTGGRLRADVEMTFSADFSRVEQFSRRALWLGLNQSDDTHTLHVKNSQLALSRNLGRQIENALEQARAALLEVSFDQRKDEDGKLVINQTTGQPQKVYRFDEQNFPRWVSGDDGRRKRFKEDLIKLAVVGRQLYDAVLGTGALPSSEEVETAQPLLTEMRRTLREEQVIQIARLQTMADIWPWSVIYDLPIDPDEVKDVCLAFRGDDGNALPYAEGVNRCQHHDSRGRLRDKTVVCPYGFWGFKHIIEQPARYGPFTELIREVKTGGSPVLTLPVARALLAEKSGEPGHIERMKALKFTVLDSLDRIIEALDPEDNPPEPHVMYFFCHGKYDRRGNPYLNVGGQNDSLWPADLDDLDFFWKNSHGLVFLNGCHTADLKPRDLALIMSPFVKAEASGVVGTEITVHSYLAREFAQKFFERLLPNGAPGQPVGQIIKDLRLELLMKYNPLGLVYTPYCSADLRMLD